MFMKKFIMETNVKGIYYNTANIEGYARLINDCEMCFCK